jgi:hypothetical protein
MIVFSNNRVEQNSLFAFSAQLFTSEQFYSLTLANT